MNQIARGGNDPTPPEGGTTRMPHTSQPQGPDPSLRTNLQGDSVKTCELLPRARERYHGRMSLVAEKLARVSPGFTKRASSVGESLSTLEYSD